MRAPERRHRGCGALLLLLTLSACGEDPPLRHGLESEALKSAPHGGSVDVGQAIPSGARYEGTLELTLDVQRTRAGGEDAGTTHIAGSVLMAVEQAYSRPPGSKDTVLSFSLRYASAQGARAEHYMALPPTQGRAVLGRNARVVPGSVRLDGDTDGTTELRSMQEGLYLAGLLGGASWLPPHAVREGEAWSLTEHVRTQALANLKRMQDRPGLDLPEPSFEATCRLEKVDVVNGEQRLLLHLESLLELVGTTTQEDVEGQIAFADRVHGTAIISARTGIPLELDVEHERRHEERVGERSDSMVVRATWRGRFAPQGSSGAAPSGR